MIYRLYEMCHISFFTGHKIFLEIVPFDIAVKSTSAFTETSERNALDGDIPIQKEKISKEAYKQNKPFLTWLKPSATYPSPIELPAEDFKCSNRTNLSKTPS